MSEMDIAIQLIKQAQEEIDQGEIDVALISLRGAADMLQNCQSRKLFMTQPLR